MGISLSRARRARSELKAIASDLRAFRRDLNAVKNELRSHWKAEEMKVIESKFTGLSRFIDSVEEDLGDIGRDIYRVAKDIKEEEDEKKKQRLRDARK